jgi:hypothetical protein
VVYPCNRIQLSNKEEWTIGRCSTMRKPQNNLLEDPMQNGHMVYVSLYVKFWKMRTQTHTFIDRKDQWMTRSGDRVRQAWYKGVWKCFGMIHVLIILILIIISYVYTYVKSYQRISLKYVLFRAEQLYHNRAVNEVSYYWYTENKNT